MRRVPGLHILFALALLQLNVAAQASKPAQVPNPALTQYQVKPAVSVEVSPNPATVNRPAQIRATATPANGEWQFEFYMNSSRLDCAIDSPVCDWTPKVSGEHSLIVLGRFGVASRGGGRGGSGTQSVRTVLAFGVEPEPVPAPTQTSTPTATPELAVRLLSDKVIAQQPARFEVSLTNAKSYEYFVNLGDGVFHRETFAVFDHAFQQDGLVTIVVRYAGVDPPLERSLTVNVEPRPLSPLNSPAQGTTPAGTDQRTDETGPRTDPDLWWPYVLAGAVILGALIVARAISRNGDKVQPPDQPPDPSLPPPIPTFHPQLKILPHFEPARTGGVSLVVIYVHNVEHVRFSLMQTNRSEG